MALGLGSSGNGEGGAFLPLAKWDARSGRFSIVQRQQGADGMWASEDVDITRQQPNFVIDFGSIEVGWIEFGKPPAFAVVPLGGAFPAKPGEGFKKGFRVKIAGRALATPDGGIVREWATTSNAVKNALEELHELFEAAPEAHAGKVPVIKLADSKAIKTTTPQGTTTNYAPVFEMVQWIDRPEQLGPRTVPAPKPRAVAAPAMTAPAPKVPELDDAIPF